MGDYQKQVHGRIVELHRPCDPRHTLPGIVPGFQRLAVILGHVLCHVLLFSSLSLKMRKKNNAREVAKISLAFSLAFILQIQPLTCLKLPGRLIFRQDSMQAKLPRPGQ